MSRPANRIPRSPEDLLRELSDQRALLQLSCEAYDAGATVAGKQIAVTLRLLLHSGKRRTRALLDLLGLRSGRFLSSAPPINAGNLLSDSPLVLIELGDAGARYRPLCAAGDPPVPPHWMPFVDWWNDPVLRDRSDRKFSRMDLVRNITDTDGGAHADADLEESYYELSRRNSRGWNFHARGTDLPLPGPELACIRQIAYEVLLTLDERFPRWLPIGPGRGAH